MPRSRRQKPYNFSKTKKQASSKKGELIEALQESLDEHQHAFVFTVHNMRTEKMNRLRDQFKDNSRFFLGKNKVMQVALGKDEASEYKAHSAQLAKHIVGNAGLFLTNAQPKDVIQFFASFGEQDFARAGCVATATVAFGAGALPQFAHTMDVPLRSLGMPVMLKRGIVTLEGDFTVCTEGDILTPKQASILKLCDIKMAEFAVTLTCHLDMQAATFKEFCSPEQAKRLAIRGVTGALDGNANE